MRADLATRLAELDGLGKAELGRRWAKLTGHPVPRASTKLLRMALAYELQARALGGLPRRARQQLDQVESGKSTTASLRPGMRLAREHGGTLHVVSVTEEGAISWNGREWRSLSEVARTITGTRWSGPAFFGLKRRKVAA